MDWWILELHGRRDDRLALWLGPFIRRFGRATPRTCSGRILEPARASSC